LIPGANGTVAGHCQNNRSKMEVLEEDVDGFSCFQLFHFLTRTIPVLDNHNNFAVVL
jgi:hypothetical protein